MFYNYLTVIFRNFLRTPIYTLIIVLGLAIGIAAALMIAQYVFFELSFDKHYKDTDRIHYCYIKRQGSSGTYEGLAHPAVGPLFKRSVPGVESFARMVPLGGRSRDGKLVRREEDGKIVFHSRETNLYFADTDLLVFFSIPMVWGNAATALKETNTMVLTQKLAEKFFGKTDPINKTLNIWTQTGSTEFTISGVTEDPKPNSSIMFDALLSMATLEQMHKKIGHPALENQWRMQAFTTFLKFRPGSDIRLAEQKINEAAREPFRFHSEGPDVIQTIHLYPFSGFHFFRPENSTSDLSMWSVRFTGDKRLITYFSSLAILILIMSWANYVNISTARSLQRAREVGLRKVNGASRWNVIVQFLMEILILNAIGMMLALTIVQVFFDLFAESISSRATWTFPQMPFFWLVLFLFLVLSSLVAGIYPAFVISGYRLSKVLKGNFSRSGTGIFVRKSLVLLQFGFSFFLLISIYIIWRQLLFMQNTDLGMAVDQVAVLRMDDLDSTQNRVSAFEKWKVAAAKIPGIRETSAANQFPGEWSTIQGFYPRFDEDKLTGLWVHVITGNYFSTMERAIIYGRDFQGDSRTDSDKLIVNETGALGLGFEPPRSAVGKEIVHRNTNKKYEIIGVVRNAYYSVKFPEFGEVFLHRAFNASSYSKILVKLSTNDLAQTLNQMQKAWEQLFPYTPFEYFFLDAYFDTFYKEDQEFAGVFGFFSLVGVLITCMGLFGLSLYNTESRTREIGIRKTVGATVNSIVWLFSKEYVRIVLIAAVTALPITVWTVNNWLESYENRIKIGADMILIPFIMMISIAFVTVSYQTFLAAHTDPVKSLKTE